MSNEKTIKKHAKKFTKHFTQGNAKRVIVAEVRHDDSCGNGHNSFAITGTITTEHGAFISGGCIHDEIAQHFPELAPLLKWHLCSTDGPMHYEANTIYHAGDRDHWGLRKGQVRDSGQYSRTGEGKERDLDAARSCALWPEATDEELMQEPEALRAALRARLPRLLEDFRRDVEALGFTF